MSLLQRSLGLVHALPTHPVTVGTVGLLRAGLAHQLLAVRWATKRSGGSTKNNRDSPGQHLGIKKFGEEFVIPGNVIIRQRGTEFFPGENVGMGRDHTLFAKIEGYVKFYREPHGKHGKVRRCIAVSYDRDAIYPKNPEAPRTRRFDLVDHTAFNAAQARSQAAYRARTEGASESES
ncbi:54S ribosomal protein L2 mitochondrial [Tieghemiomyces parasiticus]|uniref:Large ribosomal subunit protein bL27m n=1 Tax=Tieghemiomyces parasiticus TaxID=78921 RepID=A0A9W7ZQS0_9FUNG|nr:54S ribosomal protein L2 mitochondrial [Tieghemiomyces parasiticus]